MSATLKGQRGKGGGGIGPEETLVTVGTIGGTSPGGGWRIGADEAAAGQLVVANTLKGAGHDASEDGSGRQTLVAFSENQRAEVLEHDIAHQLTSGGGKPGQGYPAVRNGSAVRRLTPVECERLMGWPDGWTAPPGVKAPDSRRYAACGDGVVANVAEWIARGILQQELA